MHILISAVSSLRQPSGICRHAANLAACLAEEPAISRITLLVGAWQESYFRSAFGLQSGRLCIVPAAVGGNPLARNAWYYWSLADVARKHGADILHLSFPAPVRRERFHCPIVCSLHDLYPLDAPGNFGQFKASFNRAFLRQCLNASDAVVCSSDFTLRRLQQYAPEIASRKAVRIYQMVMPTPKAPPKQPRAGLIDGPFLLAVAQHRQNKNLHLLLAACAELRDCTSSTTQLRLVVVGAAGPETGRLQSLIRGLRLERQVVFASALNDAELCWLYSNCELLVVPSRVEGFCLPVVEALRCGARVLCSDIPVLREIGGADCQFVDLSQSRPEFALTSAIEMAMHGPAPCSPSLARFSAREIGRQYVDLYGNLVGSQYTVQEPVAERLDAVTYDQHAS